MSFSPVNIAPRFGAELVGKPILKQDNTTVCIQLNAEEQEEYQELYSIPVPDVLELRSEPENPQSPFTVNGATVAGQAKSIIKDILLNNEKLFEGGVQKRLLDGFNGLDKEAESAEVTLTTPDGFVFKMSKANEAPEPPKDLNDSERFKMYQAELKQRLNSLTLAGKVLSIIVTIPLVILDVATLPFRLLALPFKSMLRGIFNAFSLPERQSPSQLAELKNGQPADTPPLPKDEDGST